LKDVSLLPIDVHLMVENVARTADAILGIGVGMITVPIEGISNNAFSLISRIKDSGIKVGVAVNPVTPVNKLQYVLPIVDKVTVLMFDPGVAGQKIVNVTLTKVAALAETRKLNCYSYDIEVDGSCNKENFKKMLGVGATQFVVGASGLFKLDSDIEIAWQKMKEYMDV
jgi:D-allulose-6-phosphate 3-epimerase